MKIFLDTSSLIKLYVNEKGTSDIDKIFTNNVITEIFVSGVTKIEFHSAIYKKLRTKDLSSQNAEVILEAFVVDEQNFKFILIDSDIINTSQMFVKKYGAAGLRTLDAIQLASAYSVRNLIEFAVSHDQLLNSFLISEGIHTLSK